MSSIAMPHVPRNRRRRIVLTCLECRKRKQRCDRGHPCEQCVARGAGSLCTYDTSYLPSSAVGSVLLSENTSSLRSERSTRLENPELPALLHHAHHDYGYSKNSDSLNSMGMLTKVVTDIGADISLPPAITTQIQSSIRSEYYGYVRRLPHRTHCEVLFKHFFDDVNLLNSALDETMFREQLDHWWSDAYGIILENGPGKLPEDLRSFPALIFQVLALALEFIPLSYDTRLDELKFTPSQTFLELSREYSDCGVAIAKLFARARPTLIGVQHSFMRDWWLINKGYIMEAWNHSGETVRAAMEIGLHLEPEMPMSSQPEALLDALWKNEWRKRIWLLLLAWDSYMAIALGRPMFINLNECNITAPTDCDIPRDRLKRVPVARTEWEEPTSMTERLQHIKISRRWCEIRELEDEGPIPQRPEKVKELHNFAVNFRKTLPAIYRTENPDTKWDAKYKFVPIHREMLSFLVDSFLMALHRPYVFTREQSQRQVYESSLAVLWSQERLFEYLRTSPTHFHIGSTFPTFDAAVILAVVLVSNPERYHSSFSRAYQSLKNALDRLTSIGAHMRLANTGAEILQTTLRRVVEAQERVGFNSTGDLNVVQGHTLPQLEKPRGTPRSTSGSVSSDSEPWRFEVNPSAMEWTTQNLDFSEFDFSNLEVPIPLKELLLDEEMATLQCLDHKYDYNLWLPHQGLDQQPLMDVGENSLWNFLSGGPAMNEDSNV